MPAARSGPAGGRHPHDDEAHIVEGRQRPAVRAGLLLNHAKQPIHDAVPDASTPCLITHSTPYDGAMFGTMRKIAESSTEGAVFMASPLVIAITAEKRKANIDQEEH